MNPLRMLVVVAIVITSFLGGAGAALGQELEPRTFAPLPEGLNYFAVAYAFSSGNVFLDPSLPVGDVDGDVHIAVLRYLRSLSLGNRPAKLRVVLPFSAGSWDGEVLGEEESRRASGVGDIRIILDVTLSGARTMSREEFQKFEAGTISGLRFQVVAPTGKYEPEELFNVGSNRWAINLQGGVSHPFGHWILEANAGIWMFTDNDEFLGGLTLDQAPLATAKINMVRSVRPGFWFSFSGGFGYGGRTEVNGIVRDTLQRNYRLGFNLAYPLTTRTGIAVSVVSSHNLGAGAQFNALALAYQFQW